MNASRLRQLKTRIGKSVTAVGFFLKGGGKMREKLESAAACLAFAVIATAAYFIGAGLGWVILRVIKEFVG